jgi:thiol-disulfide isomerase/thioredoxin
MNKKPLSIALVILVVIAIGVVYLLASDNARVAKDNMASTDRQSSETTPQSTDVSNSTGAYTDYDENVIASTKGTKILFFHAPWCPQCRDLEADIKAKGVPGGVTIIKVDYDTNQVLRKKYSVPLQTTLVLVDDNGELVKKFVAYDEPTVEAIKNNLL